MIGCVHSCIITYMETDKAINAHTAAVRMVKHRIEQGLMTPEQGQAFTDIVYMKVNSGQWPNDPNVLGLMEHDWKISTSEAHTRADSIDLQLP